MEMKIDCAYIAISLRIFQSLVVLELRTNATDAIRYITLKIMLKTEMK